MGFKEPEVTETTEHTHLCSLTGHTPACSAQCSLSPCVCSVLTSLTCRRAYQVKTLNLSLMARPVEKITSEGTVTAAPGGPTVSKRSSTIRTTFSVFTGGTTSPCGFLQSDVWMKTHLIIKSLYFLETHYVCVSEKEKENKRWKNEKIFQIRKQKSKGVVVIMKIYNR